MERAQLLIEPFVLSLSKGRSSFDAAGEASSGRTEGVRPFKRSRCDASPFVVSLSNHERPILIN